MKDERQMMQDEGRESRGEGARDLSLVVGHSSLVALWWASVAVFVLAAATGAWLRYGMLYGFPVGLQFVNVRHAHSHLMYFGWVTPALMTLIVAQVRPRATRPLPRLLLVAIGLSILFGLLAYLPFLLYGYRPALLGGRTLPLSVMASALNVIGWYLFAWQYWRWTRGLPRFLPLHIWDTAVLFMLLATLGVWGLPLLTAFQVDSILLSIGLTYLFLETFGNGWLLLGVLGLLYAVHPTAAQDPRAARSHDRMIWGLPMLFLLGMPTHLLTWPLQLLGGLSGLLVAWGLWGHLRLLWPGAGLWRWPLVFLALKAVTVAVVIIPPVARWAEISGLRVPYLHWLLLGWISLGLLVAARDMGLTAVSRWLGWFIGAVIVLQLSLLPLTGLWPPAWSGRWALQFAAIVAWGPVLAAAGMLMSQPLAISRSLLANSRSANS
jgi:hypothetical protein